MNNIIGRLKKNEQRIYGALIISALLPVLFLKFFPTLDGPAHLYNSQLILNQLASDTTTSQYLTFSAGLVPNWIGHFILSSMSAIFTPVFAEKILLTLYFIGLPLSFRYFLKQISPQFIPFSYFIFPFLYNQPFLLGFYNFSLAFVLVFFLIGYWTKHHQSKLRLKHLIILTFLLALTYLSHIVVYLICLYLLFAIVLFNGRLKLKEKLVKIGTLGLTALPSLVLGIKYLLSMPKAINTEFLSPSELIMGLVKLSALVGYNDNIETPFTLVISITIFYLLLLAILKSRSNAERTPLKSTPQIVWISTPILVLIAYLILPNGNDYAGFVSIRFNFMFFLFVVILLSTFKLPKKWLIRGGVIIGVASLCLNLYHFKTLYQLNKVVKSCYSIGEKLTKKDIVKSISFNSNWATAHFSNYAGIQNTPLLLENYEATTNYFPLTWKSDLDLSSLAPSHIFVLKDNLDAPNKYDTLYPNYEKIIENQHCILFKTQIEVIPQ